MKISQGELFQIKEPLQRLTERDDIAIKYAMPLVRMAKKLNDEINLIEGKKNKLVMKYGDKDEKTGQVSINEASPNWEKFIKEFNELMEFEVELTINPVKIPSEVVIPNKDLILLEKFLEVEEEK